MGRGDVHWGCKSRGQGVYQEAEAVVVLGGGWGYGLGACGRLGWVHCFSYSGVSETAKKTSN